MNKFGARKVVADNITFDSQAEERRYQDLKLMQRVGEISGLRVHPEYVIHVNGIEVCTYSADFEYLTKIGAVDVAVVEDVKGLRKGAHWVVFRLKSKLFEATRGYPVTVYPPAVKKPRKRAKR